MNDLKSRSGNIHGSSKLINFLYTLMRDHITPGEVEALIANSEGYEVEYTNGWLAKYAEYCAEKLTTQD
jgi:hypothetical protein